MKRIKKHIRSFRFSLPISRFLLPVLVILLGFVTAVLTKLPSPTAIAKLAELLDIGPFSTFNFGCIFLFLLLVLSTSFLAAPLFLTIINYAFGCFSVSCLRFIVNSLGGDISFIHIILCFFTALFFNFAFVSFSQIELGFCSSVYAVLRRDRSLKSGFARILTVAAVLLLLLSALTAALAFAAPTI